MAKALFLSLPLAGHINPSLALVRELTDRGDEVVYYATDVFAERIVKAGGLYCPYRNEFLDDMTHWQRHLEKLPWLLMRTTSELFDEHLEAFRALRPDYLITDSVAPWGRWLAQILEVPLVTSVSTFALNGRVLAFAASHGIRPGSAQLFFSKLKHIFKALQLGRKLRRRYGVGGPGITRFVVGHSDLNIVYTTRLFQPCAESFNDQFQFIGPSVTQRGENSEFDWQKMQSPALVYISLGTLFNTDVTFYRKCFEAFRGGDFQVILSVGTSVPKESLGATPPNFIVQAHVPQLDILRRASVFITHGGMNSVSEGLYFGVPLVVVPQMSEQAIVGRRVEELNAGLYLAKEAVTAEKLREFVARLLGEPQFRKQAAVVSESFHSAAGVGCAADAIKAFTKH